MDNELKDFLQKQEDKSSDDKKAQPEKEYKEITLKFGKGLVGDEFQGKDGNSYRQIMIPPNEEKNQPWQSFVVKANQAHDNQFGKGMWCKLPENGSTTVMKSVARGVDEQGKTIWENEKTKVPNKELKAMVEAYKTRDKSQDKAQDTSQDKSQENAHETKKTSLQDKIEKKAQQAKEQEKKAPKKTRSKSKQAAL